MSQSAQIIFRASKPLADALATAAELNGTTVSVELRRALLAHLDREAEKVEAEKDDARRGGRAIVSDKAVTEPSLERT